MESYFNDKLSSLTADTSGYWLGGETGVVWHIDGQNKQRMETGLDRIYDVVRDPQRMNRVWIASRNAGLQQWEQDGNQLRHIETYPIAQKHDRYSPYTIAIAHGQIFTGTSQGLYAMSLAPVGKKLTRLYPTPQQKNWAEGAPFPVGDICLYQNRMLYAATPEGVICHSLVDGTTTLIHKGMSVNHIAVFDNKLHVLFDRRLRVERPDGSGSADYQLPISAQTFYKVGHTYYFISACSVQLSNDLAHFFTIPLSASLPAHALNTTLINNGSGFSIIITDNALWKFPHHMGILNEGENIVAACNNGTSHFYVNTHNELFRQSGHSNYATKTYDLPKDHTPVELCATGNHIFYYNASNALFSIKLDKNLPFNQMLTRPRKLYQSGTRITAMTISPGTSRLLLGIQDNLLAIDIHSGRTDTIHGMDNKYITNFYCPPHSEDVYISTLNHGIFCLTGSKVHQVAGTEQYPFVRDLCVDNHYDRNLFLLTNHQLLSSGPDSLRVDANSRVFYVSDSVLYTLPETGIHKFIWKNGQLSDRGLLYADIRFHPNSSYVSHERVFLGSDLGVCILTPQHENHLTWIAFDDSVPSLRTIVLAIAFLLFAIFCLWLMSKRKKIMERKQLQMRTDDLRSRAESLNAMLSLLNESDRKAIEMINRKIEDIDIQTSDVASTDQRIQTLSHELMRLNRDAALHMMKVIDQQMEEISHVAIFESPLLIKESEAARDSGNMDRIVSQSKRNGLWLQHVNELNDQLQRIKRDTEGTLVLPHFNDNLALHIEKLYEDSQRKPLSDLYKPFTTVKEEYQLLFTAQALATIQGHMREMCQLLESEKQYATTASVMLSDLLNLSRDIERCDRIVLLRILQQTDLHTRQLRMFHEIHHLMHQYATTHHAIVRENEQRIMKKFDTRLFEEIEHGTRNITTQLAACIEEAHSLLCQTDREVMEDLLHFNNINNQQVKVLLLLLADPKAKRSLLPGMLGIYGNLNPVISRLYHGKIGDNQTALKSWIAHNPSSMVFYMLKLIE